MDAMVDAARRRLTELGFERLATEHAEAAGRALAAAKSMAARRPAMVDPADEPLHVFRPGSQQP